ncbi:uncharacterized protein BDR25DRAFT_338027 [Lindgomyces ingoldianus]|uniref:Uncharacterized protein n=1 Tax=Lindgomyces ingoldianus TaxID=673940 RepID=A0ACB6Q7Y7_9PLEO|nr:uncharacterized protein BDR25DRAFT_338027 [Lindgomyces ingoldianus]KAF2463048.1 hypothetical protein BDR25DRAFT_338027 [Lindgomyces ingoldianus]
MSHRQYHITPLQFNSGCITFTEWISLYTLCLAPLIAHVVSGAPAASYLTKPKPRWHDQICLWNPTSIIWRYAAIFDRRLRAKSWSRDDLATTNAILWTRNGWDGSDGVVSEAVTSCVQRPDRTHGRILSATTLKTLITTLQGIAAIYALVAERTGAGASNYDPLMGVDMVFSPLAVLGLLRLCAAAWLTEDFTYASPESTPDPPVAQDAASPKPNARFRAPSSSWPSRCFRTFYLILCAGLWTLSLIYTVPVFHSLLFTTTSFLSSIFYLVLSTISFLTHAFYFFRGRTTTVLPCISHTWYKIYTLVIISLMVVLVIMASIETNRAPDGTYTSLRLGNDSMTQDLLPELADICDFIKQHLDSGYVLVHCD